VVCLIPSVTRIVVAGCFCFCSQEIDALVSQTEVVSFDKLDQVRG